MSENISAIEKKIRRQKVTGTSDGQPLELGLGSF
jgi:hypothetical protein